MTGTFPEWLHLLSILAISIGVICAVTITLDEFRRPHKMWIMNLVWPLTALFGTVLWTAGYYRWGRAGVDPTVPKLDPPFGILVAKGASHCGAGCTLGDLVAEWIAFALPAVATWFGWRTVFAEKLFAVWVLDFILAFLIGIAFQYYTIKPMRNLSPAEAILAAVKADFISIACWQIGMYGTMAIVQFAWFRHDFGGTASVASPEFWFAIQLAMLAGFATAYPANWLLIRVGLKEKM